MEKTIRASLYILPPHPPTSNAHLETTHFKKGLPLAKGQILLCGFCPQKEVIVIFFGVITNKIIECLLSVDLFNFGLPLRAFPWTSNRFNCNMIVVNVNIDENFCLIQSILLR